MNRIVYSILFILTVGILSAQTGGKLQWKAELQDDVKKIQPVQGGKYLFLSSDEYAWLFDNTTGKKVWSVEVKEYSEKAMHHLFNDSLYIVANEDTLCCYSMTGNNLQWKRSYQGVEQDRFSGVQQQDTVLIVSYKNVDLGISILSGKELWRTPVEYQKSLTEKGTVNSILLDKQQKMLVFTDNDECVLLSTATGKKLLTLPKSEPNGDLIEQHRAWYYLPAEQHSIALMFNKNLVVLDLDSNRIMTQQGLSISEKFNIFVPTAEGVAVIGEEKIVHVNTASGTFSQSTVDVEDLRNVVFVQSDSGLVMVVSQENVLTAVNLKNGKQLWQSAPKTPAVNGFVHRVIASDSNNIIVTYLDQSDDLKLYIVSLNVLNGKVNYRTFVAHADESLPERILPLPAVGSVSERTPFSLGFEKAGFDYDVTVNEGIASVLIHTASEMIEPNTKNEGGEGIVRVDLESGKIVSKNYMKIADGLSFKGGLAALAPVKKIGNLILLPGEKKLVALNAETGAVKWMHIEQDLNEGFVFEMNMIDTVLYVRTGGFKPEFVYDEKKEKLSEKKLWEDEGYSIMAVDTADGKIYWKKTFEDDPGRIFLDYSLSNYTSDSSQLFTADEKFLYSYSTANKGSLSWKFEFSDSGIGSFDYKALYRLSKAWSGEEALQSDSAQYRKDETVVLKKMEMISGTSNSVVSKVLHADYSKVMDRLIVIGEDGIAAVDTKKGKRLWFYEWDYDEKTIHQRPIALKNHLFYTVDGKAALLNMTTGKLVWSAKVDKAAQIYIMPDRSSVVTVEKDEVNGYIIP
ncbi:MAG: PQQ-binding-like beta-propeller repeat protein [Bacteroidota bacterium]